MKEPEQLDPGLGPDTKPAADAFRLLLLFRKHLSERTVIKCFCNGCCEGWADEMGWGPERRVDVHRMLARFEERGLI